VYAYSDRNEEQVEAWRKRTHFPSPQKTLLKPVGRGLPKLAVIEKYKQLGQALDILYRTPGYPAEQRRITPLLIEERGEHIYIIAYCQTRRAQRTFRLDRIEVPGTW
jgi:predicted DNA-binding transcriptional regulator YafY